MQRLMIPLFAMACGTSPVDTDVGTDTDTDGADTDLPALVDFGGGSAPAATSDDCAVEGLAWRDGASSWRPVGEPGGSPVVLEGAGTVEAAALTPAEAYMLHLANRARWNPRDEGRRLDAVATDWANYARSAKPEFFGDLADEMASLCAQEPLAAHAGLQGVARAFAARLNAGECNTHTCDGKGPTDRARDAGIDLGVAENIAQGARDADGVENEQFDLLVDWNNALHDTAPLGHRYNLMGPHNVVGMAVVPTPTTDGHTVQNFAFDGALYVTGTVYEDADGDSFFDPGEGVGGVTVTPSLGEAVGLTGSAGNYAIPLAPVESRTVEVFADVEDGESWEQVSAFVEAFWQDYVATEVPLTELRVMVSGGVFGDGVIREGTIGLPVEVTLEVTSTDGWRWPDDVRTAGGTRWVGGNIWVDVRL